MKKKILHFFYLFSFWRVFLFLIAAIGLWTIPWGWSFPYADTVLETTKLPPWIWGFGNFDGVHYLRIAQNGYIADNSQAFFPLYPLLIKIFNFFPKNPVLDTRVFVDSSYFYTGFILSNFFYLLAIYFLYNLYSLDFDKKISWNSILLFVFFPTSFFFGAVYTESLFLLIVVLSFYFIRKKNFLYAGIFAFLASATKILGLLLVPVLFWEIYQNKPNIKLFYLNLKDWFGLLLAPMGTFLYMLYLNINFHNPLYFLSAQPGFGAERSAMPTVLLPQVIFRYLKILINVPPNSYSFWVAVLEIVATLSVLILLVYYFKKVRFSYWIFSFGALIVPTLTGTFSSMPRYVLMSIFFVIPFLAQSKFNKIIFSVFILLLFVFVLLFTRGYWIS